MATPSNIAGAPLGTQFTGPQYMTRNQAGDPAAPLPAMNAVGPFFSANLGTNATKTVFTLGTADNTAVSMPGRGSVLGLSINVSAAPSAGTYGIRLVKNNTNVGGVFNLTGLSAQTATRFTGNMSSVTFNQGDSFKVWGSSAAALAPTTLDFAVYFWVAA